MRNVAVLAGVFVWMVALPTMARPIVPCGGLCQAFTEYCDTATDTCTTCTACGSGSFETGQCGGIDGNADRTCSTCMAHCESCTDGTVCDQCAAGYWFNPAPIGSQIGDPGECQACTPCQPGEVEVSACSPFINRVCASACPAGTYDDNGVCTDCGVADCGQCSTAGSCDACADGFFLDGGACVACTTCAAGEQVATDCGATTDTVCAQCGAGTYSDAKDSPTCSPCAAGTFAATAGATTCSTCPAGETSGVGQNQCDCPAGSMGSSGMCSQCAAGKFAASSGSAMCLDCPAGTSSGGGSASCVGCAAGSYSDSGAASCTPCPAGTFADSMSSATCTPCPAGQTSASGATACSATNLCGNGQIDTMSDGGLIEECDDGNAVAGDGCSSDCFVEDNWSCHEGDTGPSSCDWYHGSGGGCSAAANTVPELPWGTVPLVLGALAFFRRRRNDD